MSCVVEELGGCGLQSGFQPPIVSAKPAAISLQAMLDFLSQIHAAADLSFELSNE